MSNYYFNNFLKYGYIIKKIV